MSGHASSVSAPLLVEDRGAVRWLTFNRPEVHNAQNVDMLEALAVALADCEQTSSVRVLVLAGAGKSFCSGHDLKEMGRNKAYASNASTAEGRYEQEMRLFVDPVVRFRQLRIPTICRVQGNCLAAALMFASSADFVIASNDAVFGSPVLANMAVNDAEVPSFMFRVGERRAKQALWLNERWSAQEALAAGLVNWVVAPDALNAKCNEVAAKLVEAPREALAFSKDVFAYLAERQGERDFSRYHFLSHQLSHHTAEARQLLADRLARQAEGMSVVRKT